ncbi:MAG: DMT family transporter [Gemmatimonadetes bacterium]|nr:DMT family transporter [Gemmatimonadota bacterium]
MSPGIRAMALGAFWFSIMGLLVRLAGARLPTLQVIVLRCAITLVLSYAACRQAGVRDVLGTNRRLLLLRGTLGALGLLGFFHSLVRNPLAEANLLQYTNPIFAILIAGVWLKERVGRAELVSLAVCIVGVVCITRPAFLFGIHEHALLPMNVLIGVTGALFSGSAYAVVRRIGHSEHPTVVVFYLPLMGLALSLPLSLGEWMAPTGREWVLLLGTGITTQVAQTYMTRGLRLETAARATTTGYLQIVFATAWGALVLGEWPSGWTLLGAGLIVGSALWLALGRQRGGVGDE